MPLSKEDILSKGKPKTKAVEIKSLGGKVLVAVWDGHAREAFRQYEKEETSVKDNLRLLAKSLVNEEHKLLFPQEEDLDLLMGLGTDVLDEIAIAVLTANGMHKEAVEEAEKNSEMIQNSDSNSGSQKEPVAS